MKNRVVTIQENVVLFYFHNNHRTAATRGGLGNTGNGSNRAAGHHWRDYVSRAPVAAALRMTDNEPVFSALTSAAGTGCQGSSSELQHATSSQSTSSEETPLPSKAEETKGHTADDEGEEEDEDLDKEEGFSSATSSPVKLPLHPSPPPPSSTAHRPTQQTGNHVCVEDIDIELGEVCTAITKYAMSNKNCEIEVEKHELTSMTSGATAPPENSNKTNNKTPEEDVDVGFITQIDKDGNIQQVPIKFEGDQEEEANPLAMAGDMLAKPFTFVSGNTKKSRFNPFRKKSGLLNVLARQSTKNRICFKNGYLNTFTPTDENQAHKFLQDIFVSIIDLNWGWIYVIFAAAFFLSWLAFAVVWYLTCWVHGDFELENTQNAEFTPCASEIKDFTSCFLFSLETQHTIGYGGRATTEECPFAIIVMSTQSIMGVIIQACMAGIIFAKFTVPRKRGQTLVFSKNAVITQRNGALYLICRVCDLRKSSLLEAHVRMVIIKKEVTDEGETIPYQLSDLDVTTEIDGENDRVLILWPVTIAHKIDQDSPLYDMNPRDILSSQFEVVLTLEGVTEETGNTIQVRTSYLPNEILWGHQFDHNVVVYDKKMGSYQIFHSRVNKTITDDTPRLSARQLDMRSKRNSSGLSNSSTTTENNSPSKKPFKRLPTVA